MKITRKNKKQVDQYQSEFDFELAYLKEKIDEYLEISKSEHASHYDVTRSIQLIRWTSRAISENTEDLEIKINSLETALKSDMMV